MDQGDCPDQGPAPVSLELVAVAGQVAVEAQGLVGDQVQKYRGHWKVYC